MLKEQVVCFTHCTYILLEPTDPKKCLLSNLGVEDWVGSFEVGRIVEVFAVRVGVILNWKTSMIFFDVAKGCCMVQERKVHSVQPSFFAQVPPIAMYMRTYVRKYTCLQKNSLMRISQTKKQSLMSKVSISHVRPNTGTNCTERKTTQPGLYLVPSTSIQVTLHIYESIS